MSLKKLREDYEAQQVAMRELQFEVSRGKEHLAHLDGQQLALTAEVEQLQQEKGVLVGQREASLAENAELREACRLREEELAAIREQVERYNALEPVTFEIMLEVTCLKSDSAIENWT